MTTSLPEVIPQKRYYILKYGFQKGFHESDYLASIFWKPGVPKLYTKSLQGVMEIHRSAMRSLKFPRGHGILHTFWTAHWPAQACSHFQLRSCFIAFSDIIPFCQAKFSCNRRQAAFRNIWTRKWGWECLITLQNLIGNAPTPLVVGDLKCNRLLFTFGMSLFPNIY